MKNILILVFTFITFLKISEASEQHYEEAGQDRCFETQFYPIGNPEIYNHELTRFPVVEPARHPSFEPPRFPVAPPSYVYFPGYHVASNFRNLQKARKCKKSSWSAEQDEKLMDCVRKSEGSRRWSQIARGVPGKSGKACCERWKEQLNPDINHLPLVEDEVRILVSFVFQKGTRWAELSKLLPGRAQNKLKNFWHTKKRRIFKYLSEHTSPDELVEIDLHIDEIIELLRPKPKKNLSSFD